MARIKKPFSPRLMGIIFLVIGAISLVVGYMNKAQRQEIERLGTNTPGVIERGWVKHGSKGKRTYRLDVSYSVGDSSQRKEFSVTKTYYGRHVDSAERVTEPKVTVRFLPDRPDASLIVDGEPDSAAAMVVGAIFAVAGLAFLIYGILRRPLPALE